MVMKLLEFFLISEVQRFYFVRKNDGYAMAISTHMMVYIPHTINSLMDQGKKTYTTWN
jgi:hypothetical protein